MAGLQLVAVSLSSALCIACCTEALEVESAAGGESLGEAQEPARPLTIIRCKSGEHGIPCMVRCAEAGLSCASGLTHPKKADGGDGELFECREAFGGQSCWYYYESSGDICVFFGRSVGWVPPWCRYLGGRP